MKSNRLELILSDKSHFKPLKHIFTLRNDSTFSFLDFRTTRHRTRVLLGPSLSKRRATASVRIRFTVKCSLPALGRILVHSFTLVRNMENRRNMLRARSERQRRNLAVRKNQRYWSSPCRLLAFALRSCAVASRRVFCFAREETV